MKFETSVIPAKATGGSTEPGIQCRRRFTFWTPANQNSDTIVSFRIDQQSGELEPTGHVTPVPTPVCVKFFD